MTSGKMWAGILAVFVTGALLGASLMKVYDLYELNEDLRQLAQRPGRMVPMMILDHMQKELGLTGEQRQAVAREMERTHRAIEELHRSQQPRMDEIIEASHQRILKLLSPGQAEKLQQMRKKFPRPPMGPPPPFGDGPKPPWQEEPMR